MTTTRVFAYPQEGMHGVYAMASFVLKQKELLSSFKENGFHVAEFRTDDWGRSYFYLEGASMNYRTRDVINPFLMSLGAVVVYVDQQADQSHNVFRYTTKTQFKQISSANLKVPCITTIREDPTTEIIAVYWEDVQDPVKLIEKNISAIKGPGVLYYADDPTFESPLYDLYEHHRRSVIETLLTHKPYKVNPEDVAELPLKHLKELALRAHRVGEINRNLGVEYVVIPASSEFVSDFLSQNFKVSGDRYLLTQM